jgi:hypothetical protein
MESEYIVLKDFRLSSTGQRLFNSNIFLIFYTYHVDHSHMMRLEYIYDINKNELEKNRAVRLEYNENLIKNDILYTSSDLMKILKILPDLVKANKYNL